VRKTFAHGFGDYQSLMFRPGDFKAPDLNIHIFSNFAMFAGELWGLWVITLIFKSEAL
jgi:hypothetical protein